MDLHLLSSAVAESTGVKPPHAHDYWRLLLLPEQKHRLRTRGGGYK
jgi:hypothetical protein